MEIVVFLYHNESKEWMDFCRLWFLSAENSETVKQTNNNTKCLLLDFDRVYVSLGTL